MPAIDVAAEYAHQVVVARHRDYRAACESHADEREAIRLQVLGEYQAKYGPRFGPTMGGRWAVGLVANKRFAALMADKYSLPEPTRIAARHATTYGGGRKSSEEDH